MSSFPSPTAPPAASPRCFTDLLRHSHYRFTERELMHHLGMSYRNIKQREANFSTRTIGELLRVADLLNERVQDIMAVVLVEVQAGNYPPAGTD